MPRNFADRLLDAIDEKQNPSCLGLDPVISEIPRHIVNEVLAEYCSRGMDLFDKETRFEATAEVLFRFNKALIDATHDIIPITKPNIAFYEYYLKHGTDAFYRTICYALKKGMIVIADVKREDIGKTARQYANGFLGVVELLDGSFESGFNADAVTLGPYVGSDSVGEFVKVCQEFGKGAFIIDKTSNPSSGELQDLRFDPQFGGRTVYEQIALLIDQWGAVLKGERGYSGLGAVVGATYPEQAKRCREMMESAIILVPGYGSQGARGPDTIPNFNADGYGAVVNNSSKLANAYKDMRDKYGPVRFAEATREAAQLMRDDIVSSMRLSGKIPSSW